MKKLLGYFGSFLLVGTPMLTTISCNKSKVNSNGKNKNKDDENITDENNKDDNKYIDSGFEYEDVNELSAQEKEIIKNTGLFTKLLLLSRHENLNFNVNEVLSSVFAPKTTWNAFPRLYYINDEKYDLTEYTDKLTTEYSNLGRLNATHFEAFLPSNLVGMYKDKLYTNYVNNVKENSDPTVSFEYDRKDIIFPDDKNRQQLAWANFTGPLSKYIIDNDLFAYYNNEYDRMGAGRFLDQVNSANSNQKIVLTEDKTACKVKDGLDLPIKIEDSFGSLQQSIFSKQVKANFFSKILDFMPFIQNFNASSTGSIYGLRLLNSIFPFTDTDSNQDSVYVIFLALEKLCNWLSTFVSTQGRSKVSEYKAAELKESWNKINSGLKVNGKKFLELITGSGIKFKVQSLMNKDKTSVFDTLKQFIIDANKSFEYWTVEDIKAFKNYVISQIRFLAVIADKALPKVPIKEVFEKMIEFFGRDDNSSIELIKGLGKLLTVFADNQDKFLAISENDKYKDKDFDMLSKAEQNNIATFFGFNGKKAFEGESILDGLFSLFNDPQNLANKSINDFLLSPQSALYQLNNSYSEVIHNFLLQYATDKNNWKILSKSFKMEGAITGKESPNAKISYSLEYNGKGDKTVTKFFGWSCRITK